MVSALPYALYLENRNGIKVLTTILIKGNLNAKKKLMYMDVNAENTRVTRIIADNERIINISIFGSKYDLCQRMCPFDRKKKEVGPITMLDNAQTRQVVDLLDTLVDFCVSDQALALLWTTAALNKYSTGMVLLRKQDHFNNTETASYQSHMDKFFQACWVRQCEAKRRHHEQHRSYDRIGAHCRLP